MNPTPTPLSPQVQEWRKAMRQLQDWLIAQSGPLVGNAFSQEDADKLVAAAGVVSRTEEKPSDFVVSLFCSAASPQPVSQPGALCRKCGGAMAPGKAIAQTYSAGSPDFPGDTVGMTVSAGGPGKLVDCLKCAACGWSVSQPGEALPAEQPKSEIAYPVVAVGSDLPPALPEGAPQTPATTTKG